MKPSPAYPTRLVCWFCDILLVVSLSNHERQGSPFDRLRASDGSYTVKTQR